MNELTAYEAIHLGDRAIVARKDIMKLLADAKLTPVVAVGLLEDIKLKLLGAI